ncbi:hypothetical protein NE237_022757 [Protea cynaroides]|uniref:Cation/H+ exchanger transmembrane domain-containing protein n=1 Tax=Protea cynaroides TaxID=273540 RepID=A0A9Q0HB05_9MAGN|nr:hypothetical protein NE237_022757 [Protea cynaroides]
MYFCVVGWNPLGAISLGQIFPSWSTPILESVASVRLLFFLFLVGLELELKSIRRSGHRAFRIAAAGIMLPFISGIGVAYVLRTTVEGAKEARYVQFLVFMGMSLSITAFPVLACILAELKLLTTQGRGIEINLYAQLKCDSLKIGMHGKQGGIVYLDNFPLKTIRYIKI